MIRFGENQSVEGLLQAHHCVSSAALGTLVEAEYDRAATELTLQYLIQQAQPVVRLNSYWWTTPLYTLCHLGVMLKAFSQLAAVRELRGHINEHVASLQQDLGYWRCNEEIDTRVYETSLVVWLLATDDSQWAMTAADKGLKMGIRAAKT